MKKMLGKTLAMTAFSLCVSTIPSHADDQLKDADIDLFYTYLGCKVNNMPLEMRDVPVNKHDSWANRNQAPITQLQYNCNQSVIVSFLSTTESSSPPHCRFGIGFDWMLAPQVGVGGSEAERNYTDSVGSEDRGEGAALTYVGLRQAGVIPSMRYEFTDFLFNWTPRAKFEFTPFGDPLDTFWLGTSVSYYTINAQNGWDRYDEHQAHKDNTLIYVFPIKVYGTLLLNQNKNFGVTGGVQYQPSSTTSMGKKADISLDPIAYFMGFSWKF